MGDTGPDPGVADHAYIDESFDTAEKVEPCLISGKNCPYLPK